VEKENGRSTQATSAGAMPGTSVMWAATILQSTAASSVSARATKKLGKQKQSTRELNRKE
jgi:hypothetical protein